MSAKTETTPAVEKAPLFVPSNRTPVPLEKRYDFLFLFDVTNGNPNGDPENGGRPRVDPEDGRGLVSDVCMKRKVRDFILKQLQDEFNTLGTLDPYRFDIFMRSDAVLNETQDEAYAEVARRRGAPVTAAAPEPEEAPEGGKKKGRGSDKPKGKAQKGAGKDNTKQEAQALLLERYFDIRSFGAMMETGNSRCGAVKAPVWFGMAQSVDPIYDNELTITRKAITTTEDAHKSSTMGKKSVVSYGLYVMRGSVDAIAAQQTGFDQDDLAQLWDALQFMLDYDKSAARGDMRAQKLMVFEHDRALNRIPSHKLLDLVAIRKMVDLPRKFADYEVTVDESKLPKTVKFIDML